MKKVRQPKNAKTRKASSPLYIYIYEGSAACINQFYIFYIFNSMCYELKFKDKLFACILLDLGTGLW